MDEDSPVRARELERIAVDIAREAGEYIRANAPATVEVAATKTTDTDVVTAMDRAVEALIRDRLARVRPGDGFYGEESDPDTSDTGITWVVDPIDGTVNYLYGLGSFAVSIAAVAGEMTVGGWTALAGAVHDVPGAITWHAARGNGARREGVKFTMPGAKELGHCLVGTGFGYDPRRRIVQAQTLVTVLPRIRDIRRIGSAALDLCRVAAGNLDAMYERGLYPWDFAAGGLLVEEAGGQVIGLRGKAPSGQMLVAGAHVVADQLAGLLAAAGADRDAEPLD
ncbi:inositol monophosphatase family protein [Rarobacter incanus]|uniref:Inositol-1-monophosphatase n=1 Tax=Rarobacter incanus TaxID=153494 RepID=A0A542SLQ8_9MICO|nr:inositol monophosphatase family protein [Rarobacter incanus]TQK75564.1 myo-inositol-1(or 4)-monophosphatase [Rarobacter incanus]